MKFHNFSYENALKTIEKIKDLKDKVKSKTESFPKGTVVFAHSDMSGLSLFEEAHYRGVVAAEAQMAHLGHSFASLL